MSTCLWAYMISPYPVFIWLSASKNGTWSLPFAAGIEIPELTVLKSWKSYCFWTLVNRWCADLIYLSLSSSFILQAILNKCLPTAIIIVDFCITLSALESYAFYLIFEICLVFQLFQFLLVYSPKPHTTFSCVYISLMRSFILSVAIQEKSKLNLC